MVLIFGKQKPRPKDEFELFLEFQQEQRANAPSGKLATEFMTREVSE